MERQTSELLDRCSRVLRQLASDHVLTYLRAIFSVGLLRTKFQVPTFLFSSVW